jgi:precorrin-2 dehydrogenase/sirohydrochlorin ferrochelatase
VPFADSFKRKRHAASLRTVIPLAHDFRDERVLVFGGGAVGARKARRFAQEATVIVVSPAFSADSFGDAELRTAEPTPETVHEVIDEIEPALVIAATDDEALNTAIEESCLDRSLLCNRADAAGARRSGSVVVPATVRDDSVVVSVSTGGKSPALSRHLRKEIEPVVAGAGAMAELTADLRRDLKASEAPEAMRRAAIRAVIDSERVWKALDTEGANARTKAVDVIEKETGRELTGDLS